MSIVKSISKPVLEVIERQSILRSTTVKLKVTFNVTFDNPSGIPPEGRDMFHARYGVRIEVNGYKDPYKQTRDNHTHLFNFKRIIRRRIFGAHEFFDNPFGGRFIEIITRDFLLSGNLDASTGGPYMRPDDFNLTISYNDQTATSQEVSFDLLDVNKSGEGRPWSVSAELDLIFVRL